MGHSFAEVHPELVCEWSEKNAPLKVTDITYAPLKVTDITYGSNKRYWWIGKCGHEWLASPKDRHAGERCPYCAGMRVLEGFNDLASIRPDLVAEWSSENELQPTQVNAQSHRKVKWKGLCGHEWTAEIRARVKGTGCPYCTTGSCRASTILPPFILNWQKSGLRGIFPGLRTRHLQERTEWSGGDVIKVMSGRHLSPPEQVEANAPTAAG